MNRERRRLLTALRKHGARLKRGPDGGVTVQAKRGTLEPDLVEALRQHKSELSYYLDLQEQPTLERKPLDPAMARELAAWAQALIDEHRSVNVETPNDPQAIDRIVYPCDTLEQLLFYRVRAERWGTWGTCRAGKKNEIVSTWGSVPAPQERRAAA